MSTSSLLAGIALLLRRRHTHNNVSFMGMELWQPRNNPPPRTKASDSVSFFTSPPPQPAQSTPHQLLAGAGAGARAGGLVRVVLEAEGHVQRKAPRQAGVLVPQHGRHGLLPLEAIEWRRMGQGKTGGVQPARGSQGYTSNESTTRTSTQQNVHVQNPSTAKEALGTFGPLSGDEDTPDRKQRKHHLLTLGLVQVLETQQP